MKLSSIRVPVSFWILIALFLAIEGGAADLGFRISQAELALDNSHYVLNADIDYRFSETAIDALRNGVPLTLVLHLKLKRLRAYWWDETILSEQRLLRIRYHPLTKLFQLSYNSGAPQNFASLSALLDAMGTLRRMPVLRADRISKGEHYRASLSVRLDIESLPLPLRPIAYVTPAWYLNSPLYQWQVEN
jgi:hypothetical protein